MPGWHSITICYTQDLLILNIAVLATILQYQILHREIIAMILWKQIENQKIRDKASACAYCTVRGFSFWILLRSSELLLSPISSKMLYLWQESAGEWIEYFKLDLTKGPFTLTQPAYTFIDLYSIDMH